MALDTASALRSTPRQITYPPALLAGILGDDVLTGRVMAGTIKAIPKSRAAQPPGNCRWRQVLSISGGLTMW